MHTRLTRLANDRNTPIAEVAREALRAYLDEQEDVQGSRKHFTKMFQRRVDFLEWQLSVLLWVICRGLAFLISHASGQKLTADVLMDQAIRQAQERHAWLHNQLRRTVKELEKEDE
jgi:predicted transcriptional regulator